MDLYFDIVRQVNKMFDIGAVFALGLINAIKKDKSFEIELWTKNQVNLLVALIKCHVKAARIGKSRHEEMLKTINKCSGLEITGFFHSCNESEKTLCQLAHLSSHCFPYHEA